MIDSLKCPRCGLKKNMSIIHCPVCGYEFKPIETNSKGHGSANSNSNLFDDTNKRSPSRAGSPFTIFPENHETFVNNSNRDLVKGDPEIPASVSEVTTDYQNFDIMAILGYRKLSGVIIAVEQPYMVKHEINWAFVVLKVILTFILFPFIISLLIFSVIAPVMFSLFLGKHGNHPGFFSNIASQVVGFFLTQKLLGPKDLVPVRDIRLRDINGQEHLIRFRGELIAGNLNVGDNVEVEGYNRRGTLMFRRGFNKRTRSEILISYR
jgi:hypothetical protein